MNRRPKSKPIPTANSHLRQVPQLQKDWNKVVRELNKLHVELIEYDTDELFIDYWTVYFKQELGEKSRPKTIPNFNMSMNKALVQGLTRPKGENLLYWTDELSEGTFAGFYIPMSDIEKDDPQVMESFLRFYSLVANHFDYANFFLNLRQSIKSMGKEEDLLAYSIWYYIFYYGKFLHKLRAGSIEDYSLCAMWYTEFLDQNSFYRRLPSEQVVVLLLSSCEELVSDGGTHWMENPLLAQAHSAVRKFFDNHSATLTALYQESGVELDSLDLAPQHRAMIADLDRVLYLDKEELFLQEILDDASDAALYKFLTAKQMLKFGPKSIYNLTGVVKDILMGTEYSLHGSFKEDFSSLPNFKLPKEEVYVSSVQYWYDLLPEQRDELRAQVFARADSEKLSISKAKIRKRLESHRVNVMNLITSPILFWVKHKDKYLIPQWNLLEDETGKKLRQLHNKRKKKLREEKKLLEGHLKSIAKLDSLEALIAYQEQHNPSFSDATLQKKWEHEYKRMEVIFLNRASYYDSRMEEFGFPDTIMNKNIKAIWLKEILQIEEEVKPYVNFVIKAFQSALPVRRTVVFSEDRHISDGLEFDPDTLYDHEKWIRADVMKAMQTKVDLGEAIQINTFCLDYSGSMYDDRMRNLFKTLYLLVLGLEDRKSFDAFHFFSDRFIDVVGFSSEFTNRKVLLKILRQITEMYNSDLIYRGAGGTNISDGIAKSNEKMQAFRNKFLEENPEANIVCSIFVITDGQPSLGITEISELNEFIEQERKKSDVEIKGIFIKSEEEEHMEVMEEIFGTEHYVETSNFQEGVNKFVRIMTQTYKQQRKDFKWKKKRQKLGIVK